METILIIGIVQSLFLSLLIFSKKNKSNADRVLGIWMLFIASHLSYYYLNVSEISFKYPFILGIGEFFAILQGPFLYIYTLLLVSKDDKFKRIYLLHSLPFILIMAHVIPDFCFLPAEEKILYYNKIGSNPPLIYFIGFILNNFLGVVYVVLTFFVLRKHNNRIEESFSYSEQIDLKWLKYLLIAIACVWIIVVLSYFLNIYGLESIALTIAIFFLGYFGFKQPTIFTNISIDTAHKQPITKQDTPKTEQPDKYKKSGLKSSEIDKYTTQLIEFIKQEKPYLNNKLTLNQLAEAMNLSTNHLSQIINEKMNKNFFDFINEYRVNEIKNLLPDPKYDHYTLLGVAFESGFNSKTSFNNIFKKFTGKTPSEYKKKLVMSSE